MRRSNKHPSRKDLKQAAASVQAELDQLKTPQGVAEYLHSKRLDEDFQEAVSARIFELRDEERQAAEAPESATEPAEQVQSQ